MPTLNFTKSVTHVNPARLHGNLSKDEDTGVYFKPVSSALVDLEDFMHNKQIKHGLNEQTIRN